MLDDRCFNVVQVYCASRCNHCTFQEGRDHGQLKNKICKRNLSFCFSHTSGTSLEINHWSHYTDSEQASRLPNSLMLSAKLRNANLPVFTSLVGRGRGSNPASRTLSGRSDHYDTGSVFAPIPVPCKRAEKSLKHYNSPNQNQKKKKKMVCRCFIGSFPQNVELIRFIQFSRIGFYERRRSIHDGRPCRNNSSSEGAREKMRYIQLLELSAFSRQLVYITRSKHYANYP